MSRHNGNIPTRQEFVLFDRKKHYFCIEKANVESWDLMILGLKSCVLKEVRRIDSSGSNVASAAPSLPRH
jgi:hypothetical protein